MSEEEHPKLHICEEITEWVMSYKMIHKFGIFFREDRWILVTASWDSISGQQVSGIQYCPFCGEKLNDRKANIKEVLHEP